MLTNVILYCLFCGLLIASILMILCINPLHSVIFFILVFFCSAMLFTLVHVDFIGFVFLMVYVGAIAVLFVFVVMMLNIRRIERDNTTYLLIGGFICFLFSLQLTYQCISAMPSYVSSSTIACDSLLFDAVTNNDELLTRYFVRVLGTLLFSNYGIALLFSGLTLLVALIGAIYLTNTTTGYSLRTQHNQLLRNNMLFNLHIY
jgi:NADH-quinone oxidoreductase subunit J